MARPTKYPVKQGKKCCSRSSCTQTNPQPIEHFQWLSHRNTYRSECKTCTSWQKKQHRSIPAVKERTRATFRQYYYKYRTPELLERKRQYAKEYRKKYPERLKLRREQNKIKNENSRLLKTYGITLERKQQMYTEQQGHCQVCKAYFEFSDLFVDHCHKTGAVRALLCRACNNAEGWVRSSSEIAKNLMEYLKQWNG